MRGVRVSLLDRRGNLPQRSGLNWGQRPEESREPNQAYFRLPAKIYRSDFFPERPTHFILQNMRNENDIFFATRAQDNGKAIHSTENNSIIGKWVRDQLGVPHGQAISTEDLVSYGKTFIDFYRVNDETYLFDF